MLSILSTYNAEVTNLKTYKFFSPMKVQKNKDIPFSDPNELS